jgi:hypothetical protein
MRGTPPGAGSRAGGSGNRFMPTQFEIYRDGQRVTDFVPVAASAVGPESLPVPADVFFRDGLLTINRVEQAVGVALLWDCGDIGVYHLETCRLPQRDKPYVLNVELARNRLMKLVQKQEDWNLFDFPKAEKLTQGFRDAQLLFAESLGMMEDPAAASRIADRALAMAIDVSEQMAHFHADLLLNRRRANNAMPKHLFGCKIDWTIKNQKYRDLACESLDYAVLPMAWRQLQPEEDQYSTEQIDEWIELLTRRRVPIVAGPIIDLSEDSVPDWAYIWEHDFETLRDLAYEFTRQIVHRYRKHVTAWVAVGGLHLGNAFNLSFEQMIELTRLLCAEVKSMQQGARVLVGIRHPYGEYHASNSHPGVPPILYAEMVAQSGVSFDAFALDLVSGVPAPGMYTRDLFQVSSLLDRFSTMGKPVFITGSAVPGRDQPDPQDHSEGRLDPSAAGRWRKPWDGARQAEWLDAVYKIALSKPYIDCLSWESLSDLAPTLPAGGLLDDMLKPKPAFNKLQEIRELYQRGRK